MNFSVAAIIKYKGKYLLQKRDKKKNIFYPNFFGLFGGTPLKNESPSNCLKRELYEELNLLVKERKHFLTTDIKSEKFRKKNASIFKRFFFECELPFNYKKKLLLKEGSGYSFLSMKDINCKKLVPFDFAAIYFFELLKSKKKIIPKKYLK